MMVKNEVGKTGKLLLGMIMLLAACCCAAFELKDGTYLNNVKFQKVSRKGLVFSHDDGVVTLKPEDLPEAERATYAAEIKEYQRLARQHKENQTNKANRIKAENAKRAAELKKIQAQRQKKLDDEIKRVARIKGKARYERALKLLRESQMTRGGKKLNYSALIKIINDSKNEAIHNPKIKDVRKVAYILILRVYIFKIVDRVDAAKTPWLRNDLTIKVENMRNKLWRLMRSLDVTDQVICAEFFKHNTFVSGGTYKIDPPIKPLWQHGDSQQAEIDVNNKVWTEYKCLDISSSDTWEFCKYLVAPSREFGSFVKEYIKQEETMLKELLAQSYLKMEDVDKAEVDKHLMLKKCAAMFYGRKVELKCKKCSGYSINGVDECRECSRYGIMLWKDYTSQTDI